MKIKVIKKNSLQQLPPIKKSDGSCPVVKTYNFIMGGINKKINEEPMTKSRAIEILFGK